ncbi:MAG: ATP phosphoribosyltransferase regulatory subunit [Candidatus Atribacteria bacterium]|nr:ATP phosphoribosyltransferase regulatory subunit [Candidatus Atribacteria bacterium]
MDLVLGMKDTHPQEVLKKREIELKLRHLFSSWGFEEVETPTLEYYTTLQKVIGDELKDRLFQFINREGKLVCLRPDFTTSIARKYSSNLFDENKTIRIFYDGKIFRYPSSPLRTESELTQMGLENIGNNSPAVDAEVIALAIISLQEAGIVDFAVDIGHVGFFRGILDTSGYSSNFQQQLKTIVKAKDFIALKNFLEKNPPTEPTLVSLLLDFPFLRGKKQFLNDVINRFPRNHQFTNALERIQKVWDILSDFGLERNIWVNLGLIRDFDYYSGMIFEGFSAFSGSPLLAGGRYDELFGIFGQDRPACGFALFIERLVEVCEKSQPEMKKIFKTYTIFYPPEYRKPVFNLTQKLRKQHRAIITQEQNDVSFTLKLSDGLKEYTWMNLNWDVIYKQIEEVIENG